MATEPFDPLTACLAEMPTQYATPAHRQEQVHQVVESIRTGFGRSDIIWLDGVQWRVHNARSLSEEHVRTLTESYKRDGVFKHALEFAYPLVCPPGAIKVEGELSQTVPADFSKLPLITTGNDWTASVNNGDVYAEGGYHRRVTRARLLTAFEKDRSIIGKKSKQNSEDQVALKRMNEIEASMKTVVLIVYDGEKILLMHPSWRAAVWDSISKNQVTAIRPTTDEEGFVGNLQILKTRRMIDIANVQARGHEDSGITDYPTYSKELQNFVASNTGSNSSKGHTWRNAPLITTLTSLLFLGTHFIHTSAFKITTLGKNVNGIYGALFARIIQEMYEATIRLASTKPFVSLEEFITTRQAAGSDTKELLSSYNQPFWEFPWKLDGSPNIQWNFFLSTAILDTVDAIFVSHFKLNKKWVPFLFSRTEAYDTAFKSYKSEVSAVLSSLQSTPAAAGIHPTARFEYFCAASQQLYGLSLPLLTANVLEAILHTLSLSSDALFQIFWLLDPLANYTKFFELRIEARSRDLSLSAFKTLAKDPLLRTGLTDNSRKAIDSLAWYLFCNASQGLRLMSIRFQPVMKDLELPFKKRDLENSIGADVLTMKIHSFDSKKTDYDQLFRDNGELGDFWKDYKMPLNHHNATLGGVLFSAIHRTWKTLVEPSLKERRLFNRLSVHPLSRILSGSGHEFSPKAYSNKNQDNMKLLWAVLHYDHFSRKLHRALKSADPNWQRMNEAIIVLLSQYVVPQEFTTNSGTKRADTWFPGLPWKTDCPTGDLDDYALQVSDDPYKVVEVDRHNKARAYAEKVLGDLTRYLANCPALRIDYQRGDSMQDLRCNRVIELLLIIGRFLHFDDLTSQIHDRFNPNIVMLALIELAPLILVTPRGRQTSSGFHVSPMRVIQTPP